MERIMMTSMAMARQLMSERRGRWTRLPTTSLFILVPVYWERETVIGQRPLRVEEATGRVRRPGSGPLWVERACAAG